jgi:hypothetical protein
MEHLYVTFGKCHIITPAVRQVVASDTREAGAGPSALRAVEHALRLACPDCGGKPLADLLRILHSRGRAPHFANMCCRSLAM